MHKGQLQEATSQGYGFFPPAFFGTMAYFLVVPGGQGWDGFCCFTLTVRVWPLGVSYQLLLG